MKILHPRKTPGNNDIQVYMDTVTGQYFPIVEGRMMLGGPPISDYWDLFAIMEYTRLTSLHVTDRQKNRLTNQLTDCPTSQQTDSLIGMLHFQ